MSISSGEGYGQDQGSFADSPEQGAYEHLKSLDGVLQSFWKLGRNAILVWAPRKKGIDVLVVPNYAIADLAAKGSAEADEQSSGANPGRRGKQKTFIDEVISGPKHLTVDALGEIAVRLKVDPEHIDLSFVPGEDVDLALIDSLVRRYSLSYVEDRAVALFDIVNFSLYSPLEQVTQLNSLAYSVNAAHSKMMQREIDMNFARSTTGDGFYIWNRDRSIQGNVNLYHFMHLILADNAISQIKSERNAVPTLRTCFDIGGYYEFYQSEGLSPSVYSYIVGDVTIELARMIDKAIAGQVMVGDFRVKVADEKTGDPREIDSIEFIEQTRQTLANLEGLVLSGDQVESIQCYLTGEPRTKGGFGIKKYSLRDKHDLTRDIFNAKINIYRENAEAIFLGV